MRSLRTKIASLVATAVISAVALASLLSAWHDMSRRFAAKRSELQGIAATIATALAHPLAQGDRSDVARTLSAMGRIPGLTFARVTDMTGHTVHQYGFGVILTRELGAVEANAEIGPLTALYLETYPVAAPIVSGGNQIGRLTLIADISNLRGAVRESLVFAIAAGAMAVVIGLLISWRLQRGISRPVLQLTSAMREVSRTKDFAQRVTLGIGNTDEIDTLVQSFNGMLDEVRLRDEALARHRDRLEIEVADRTRELVHARQEAESANAAKSDFLATMSHEIRTPMNGMLVTAELIATADLPPRIHRYAQVLVNSGKSLLAIINDILDLSKIEAGKLELERVPVDIRSVVDDVVALFQDRAASQGLDLSAFVASEVPLTISSDPTRLTQVLSNLVSNALKFTASGHVAIRVSFAGGDGPDNGMLTLAVSDTGIGIPSDKLAHIFDAFAQADQSTTRRFGGTGIGLSICRRLARAMGGELSVQSEVGRGSTFSMSAPVDIVASAPAILKVTNGTDSRLAITCDAPLTGSFLRDYALERGFTVEEVPPDLLASKTWSNFAALIAPLSTLKQLDRARVGHGVDPDSPIVVGLSRDGATTAERSVDLVLGLPLSCREIAACLDAMTRGPNGVADLRQSLERVGAAEPAARHHDGIRVLAADDNAVNREVLGHALSRLGIEVVHVEDGAAALAAATSQSFAMAFMDCNMPVMDGVTATREIRKWELANGRPPMPIVALTAHTPSDGAEAWRDAGMSDYLTKPFTLQALDVCLENALGAHSTVRAGIDASSKPSPSVERSRQSTRTAVDSVPLLDPDVMAGIRSMQKPGDDLTGRILRLYAEHAPRALAILVDRSRSGTADAIADAAHALRSQSLNIGAVRVAHLCQCVEDRARQGDTADASEHCFAIRAALDATLAAQSGNELDLRKAS